MKSVRWRAIAAWLVVTLALAVPLLSSAQAATPSGEPKAQGVNAAAEITQAIQWSQRHLDNYLAVPADWPLSAQLRGAAESMLAEATPRLRATLGEWALDLHTRALTDPALSASQREAALSWALDNRLLNEQALNSLDTEGDAHDAWRMEVEAKPGWCRMFWPEAKWGEVLLQIERLPEQRRAAALQHERDVLARWGRVRPAVPPRPAFALDAYASGLLTRVLEGRPDRRPPVAMVPVVAAKLLHDKAQPLAGSDSDDPPERSVRCAALQWAQANARAERAAAPADLGVAFRHALMFRAEDLARQKETTNERAKALIELGYPLHVALRELTGTVRIRIARDESGRIAETRVVGRNLTAPGLEGRRPVFFETALDAASIARARALPAGDLGSRTVEFVWKLE